MSLFPDFDFSALDNLDFKEDAVREEIITPILQKIGYRPTGEIRVQRSKSLSHPFVMIGSKKHPVNIVPDYTLLYKDEPLMVLDAKSPREQISQSKHVEQAFSYAIHPDMRCDYYGLCNGRELIIYSIRAWDPILRIAVPDIDSHWEDVYKGLHPRYLVMPELRDFVPDFGLYAVKAGFGGDKLLVFVEYYFQDIAKVRDNLYTSSSTDRDEDREYAVSFDYDQKVLNSLLDQLQDSVKTTILSGLSQQPFRVDLGFKLIVTCTGYLGEVTEGAFEEFVPVELQSITEARFDPKG